MNIKLFNIVTFTMGAAVGSLVTWKIMKDRCERTIQDEISAFKNDWVKMTREDGADYNVDIETDKEDIEEEGDWDDEEYSEYATLAHSYDHNCEEGGGDEVPYVNGPYVIPPEDFGGERDFDHWLLSYFSDGVLADDYGVTYDIEETIGEEALEHFGDYTEDVVHVRNERLQCEYEISKDPRTYDEAMTIIPRMNEHA